MKNLVLLGSTGSIGTSTLKVVDDLGGRLRVVGLAAGSNVQLLADQARRYLPEAVCLNQPDRAQELQTHLKMSIPVCAGPEGLIQLATLPSADIVLIAIVGTAGLAPAL